jgi:hypothetical protein
MTFVDRTAVASLWRCFECNGVFTVPLDNPAAAG